MLNSLIDRITSPTEIFPVFSAAPPVKKIQMIIKKLLVTLCESVGNVKCEYKKCQQCKEVLNSKHFYRTKDEQFYVLPYLDFAWL